MKMPVNSLRCLSAAALLAAPLALGASGPEISPAPTLRTFATEPPHNLCFGGLEDRKRIVHETQLQNPFRETTYLGCEIDGGKPVVMPDLPRPTHVRTLIG